MIPMKRILSLISAIVCSLSLLHAQTTAITVSGNVKDKDKSPLQGCTVYFIQADTLVGGSITDKKGDFSVKGLQAGDYVCRVSMVGFKKIEHPFKLTGSVRLPQFTLQEDATQLKEVTVTGDKRNIVHSSAGSTTFFLSEHAKTAKTAYDALLEVPKLVVNPIERNIKLLTGESPIILIDGVNRPGYINVMNPEIIESVEIIDVPDARYLGEEGVTAILNIHLKRVATPTYVNGNIYANHALTYRYGVTGGGAELGNAKSSLYLNLQSFYFSDTKSNEYSESQSGDIRRKFSGEQLYSANSYYAALGGDRIFSDKNYAAFALKYISNPSDTESHRQGNVEYASEQKQSDATVYNQSDNKYHLATAYLYYKHSFSKHQSLEATGNYSYSYSGSIGEQQEHNDFYQYHNLIDYINDRHYGKLDLDYTNLIQGKYSLTAGSNTSYSSTNIDDKEDCFPVYNYKKWQEYLYVGFNNNRSGGKFFYLLSIGMDMLFTEADGVKNHYIDVLPSVALIYKFNQKHNLNLSYRRHRYSPTLSMLNPRNTSTDSLLINQGNPYLRPSFQDQVRLSYKLSYKSLFLEPYISYSYSSKLINAVGTLKDNIYIQSYRNLLCANFLNAGTSANYNLPFGNIGMSAYYERRYQKGMTFANADLWNFNMNAYLYYKQVSLSLNMGYTTASYGYTTKSEGTPYSNANLSWNLPKNWRVYVMGQYFVGTGMWSKSWVKDEGYTSYKANYLTDRIPTFSIGASYTFKNKVQNKWRQKKQFNNDDRELQGIGVK